MLSVMRGIELYSYMVPQESCFDLLPLHNSTARLNATPYKIIVKNKYFRPNEQVQGTVGLRLKEIFLIIVDKIYQFELFVVTLTSDQLSKFSGFVLQARSASF